MSSNSPSVSARRPVSPPPSAPPALIRKSHNVSLLIYHIVCPAKYRRAVVDAAVEAVLRDVCLEIEARYEIKFLEIGVDQDHVHFLVQGHRR